MNRSRFDIRELRQEEAAILDTFLYEAIFVPEGETALPREIIKKPELQVYVSEFGKQKDDLCYVAEAEGDIVGAVWCRIMNDYGHVDENTPSLSISVLREYRNCGMGTALMKQMLAGLKERGYHSVSLSVQKQNYAAKMYRKHGFAVVADKDEEYIMVCDLSCVKNS